MAEAAAEGFAAVLEIDGVSVDLIQPDGLAVPILALVARMHRDPDVVGARVNGRRVTVLASDALAAGLPIGEEGAKSWGLDDGEGPGRLRSAVYADMSRATVMLDVSTSPFVVL